MLTGGRLTLPNRCSTATTIRSRTSSPVVAKKLMASRSQRSSAKATLTRSPLSQPISKPSEHQLRLRRRGTAADPNSHAVDLNLDGSRSPVRPTGLLALLSDSRAIQPLRIHPRQNKRGHLRLGTLRRRPSRLATPREQLLRREPMPTSNVETTAPGTNVSSMMRALSSTENRRRRPAPVIASKRRTVVALAQAYGQA
jgi:hypothetical protein